MTALLGAASALLCFASPAHAARRALVVGNAQYARAADLPNPHNDASDVAARLEELGFELAGGGPLLDLTRDRIAAAVRDFAASLEEGDLALFYFAGHGAQARGENYLIPTNDEEILFSEDLADYAYSAAGLLSRLEGRPGVTSVVILDACRNNPLGSRARDMGDGEGSGLAHMDAPSSAVTFIIFAAAKGRTASDGEGRNSRFTSALLNALQQPERRLDDIAYEIRASVRRSSDGAQIPWISSSLDAPVYLVPPDETAPVEQARPEQTPVDAFAPDADPSYAPVTLAAGFEPDPVRLRVLAGGTIAASEASPDCRGLIARRPDYVIDYQAGTYPLHFAASSAADTTLVVRDPDGVWRCDDDFEGVNPAISIGEPRSGVYRVWVGVYSGEAGYPGAELVISEIEPQF